MVVYETDLKITGFRDDRELVALTVKDPRKGGRWMAEEYVDYSDLEKVYALEQLKK